MITFKRQHIVRWLSATACALIFLGMNGMALAAPPVVKTVPWVATNPLIPHDTWSGKTITLKGTSDVQGANIQYSWDFGDGSPPATGVVTNMNVIEATHSYTGNNGDVFTARLTVENTSTGETGSKTYFVAIRNQTLETEVNVAIDEGLWNLHKTQILSTCNALPCSYWPDNYYSYLAPTGSSVNAFEANGHLESGDASNPYTETVRRGLRYLFSKLVSEPIATTPAGNDPDSNGNGIGIRANEGNYPYIGGIVMDAIITSNTPNAVTVTGPANVLGRRYADIVQDMVDSYAWGQYDYGANRGGWRYVWNQGPDNSAAQWGAIGMIPAERNWGLIVPAWVKTENLVWMDYSQYFTGYEWSSSYGCFGYTYKGATPAGTASGMVQLAFDGVLSTDTRWQIAEKCIRDRYASWFPSGNLDYYAMFAFTKAMRQANPAPVVNFGATSGLGALDWYHAQISAGDPENGFARILVDRQNADGSWSASNRWYIYPQLSTPWSVLILGRSLFEAGSPVAVAKAIPNPGVVGQVITLDGSASFHQDASKTIDSWEWDLNNDGTFDATGPTTSNSWPALGDYPVKLRVTDNGTPEKSHETIVTVRITTPPVAPTANADGPYVFCPQAQPWFLDGTGSVNPDEGVSIGGAPGDTIQSYAWELDGYDGDFDEAFGPQPDVTAFFTAQGVGDYLIQLRVTDTTATSFPGTGLSDLSDTDSTHVRVKDAADPACAGCIDDLTARAKDSEVQIVWTDTGAHHYNVYRSTTQGGPYTFVATTTSTYSTYLDTGLTNGTTYYYVVRQAELNGAETCQSNEASATPTARTRRR